MVDYLNWELDEVNRLLAKIRAANIEGRNETVVKYLRLVERKVHNLRIQCEKTNQSKN